MPALKTPPFFSTWLDRLLETLRSPGRSPALTATQTAVEPGTGGERAMVGALHRELAEHPSQGLTPTSLYAILQEAEAGDLTRQHALFCDMEEKDAQISSDLAKRKLAAARLEWQIVPPDHPDAREHRATDQAIELFRSLEVEDLIVDLGDGIGHGWVNLELPWRRDGALRVIDQPRWVDHTWFQLHPERRDELRLRDGSMNGEELWPLGWLAHRHKAKSGYVSRLGLHRSLVWPYLFQNHALGDLAELLEILGIPARLGTYPRGASVEEKSTLLTAVASLGHRAAGIIPDGMAIEYLEAAQANGDAHQRMLDWCERVKSKVILGGTLTTGTDRGSGAYSLGEVHERGLADLIASDARQYAATLRRDLLFPLARLNFGIDRPERAPRWYLDLGETEDYETLSKALPVFVDLGMKIPAWWAHEKTGIPEAEGDEPILAKAVPVGPVAPLPGDSGESPRPGNDRLDDDRNGDGPDDPDDDPRDDDPDDREDDDRRAAALSLAGRAALRVVAPRRRPDYAEIQTARLGQVASAAIDGWVARLRQELDAAIAAGADLATFAERLLTLYPELPDGDLAALLGEALTAADLAGRYELDTNQGLLAPTEAA
jgi:phage gp29-like protein